MAIRAVRSIKLNVTSCNLATLDHGLKR